MENWLEEMKAIERKRKWAYRCPLPKKKQRVTAKAERPGPVKVFTKDQIVQYMNELRKEAE